MTDAPRIPRDFKPAAGRPRRRGGAARTNGRRALGDALRGLTGLGRGLVERLRRLRRQPLHAHTRWLLPVGAALVALPLLSWTFDAVAGLKAGKTPRLQRVTQPLNLPGIAAPEAQAATLRNEALPAADAPESWQAETVRPGDTLAAVFKRLGLGPRDVHRVVSLDEDTRRLTRIYPGDVLRVRLTPEGAFDALEYQLDESRRLRVSRTETGLSSELIADDMIAQVRTADGVIDDSFFLAGRRAGLSDKMIMELAGLFGWDIDFVLDIRRGDEFYVLFEALYRNGEYLRPGQIIAATFVNQGRKYQAVRFETENGMEYFSPDGRNMKKAFLRAPLNFSYISSNFNPKRFHPILQRVKAHKGTDYRAPTGTPVYAAGHGKVIASAKNRYNGNYVFIQHGNNIVTKYLHFSRRTVKKGQRVKQGQVIGYVGATGLAEAPHLHYEFLVNGVHRNPRTVDLPKADPLPQAQLASFQRMATPLLRQLDGLQERELLALEE